MYPKVIIYSIFNNLFGPSKESVINGTNSTGLQEYYF